MEEGGVAEGKGDLKSGRETEQGRSERGHCRRLDPFKCSAALQGLDSVSQPVNQRASEREREAWGGREGEKEGKGGGEGGREGGRERRECGHIHDRHQTFSSIRQRCTHG